MISIRKTYCHDSTVIYWCLWIFCIINQEANHTSCSNIQYQLVKELNGDMNNKLVKLCHMKLGKASHSRKKPMEQKVNEHCFPCLISHLFFFFSNLHFLLFCPFCTHSQEFQQTRTSATVQTRALPRHVSATLQQSLSPVLLLRDDAARGTK